MALTWQGVVAVPATAGAEMKSATTIARHSMKLRILSGPEQDAGWH
jgi:hypothetical protein